VSLSGDETVKLIRSFGDVLSLTVITVQTSVDERDSSTSSETRTYDAQLYCTYINPLTPTVAIAVQL